MSQSMMRPIIRKDRRGFSLVELLVVLAIIVLLLGLLLPAVFKARSAADAIKCSNNLRQLGMASDNCHEVNGKFPTGLGWFAGEGPPGAYGTFFFHLLPYLEAGNVYDESSYANCYFAGNDQVYTHPVEAFL